VVDAADHQRVVADRHLVDHVAHQLGDGAVEHGVTVELLERVAVERHRPAREVVRDDGLVGRQHADAVARQRGQHAVGAGLVADRHADQGRGERQRGERADRDAVNAAVGGPGEGARIGKLEGDHGDAGREPPQRLSELVGVDGHARVLLAGLAAGGAEAAAGDGRATTRRVRHAPRPRTMPRTNLEATHHPRRSGRFARAPPPLAPLPRPIRARQRRPGAVRLQHRADAPRQRRAGPLGRLPRGRLAAHAADDRPGDDRRRLRAAGLLGHRGEGAARARHRDEHAADRRWVDLFLALPGFPQASGWLDGAALFGVGLVLNGAATGLYLTAGLGAGPRDGFALALAKLLASRCGAREPWWRSWC
jgi:hypothetical protein